MSAGKTKSLEEKISELLTRISNVRGEIVELKNQKRMLLKLKQIKKARE